MGDSSDSSGDEHEPTAMGAVSASADAIADKTVAKIVSNTNCRAMFKDLFAELMGPFLGEVKGLKTEVEKLRGEVLDLHKINKKLTKENEKKEQRITALEESDRLNRLSLIDNEQKRMNNYLMITGVPEKAKADNTDSETAKPDPEVTDKVVVDLVRDKLGIELKEEDINLSYRAKHANKRNKHGPRPIYVGFTRLSVRRKIISARRKLKDTGLGIQEVLCYGRAQVLQYSQKLVNDFDQAKACWSWDGMIYVLVNEGKEHSIDKKIPIRTFRDIDKLAKKLGFKPTSEDEE